MKIDVIRMLKNALANNELKQFLLGYSHYNIPSYSGFNTDKDVVLFGGIYGYYKENPDSKLDLLYQETLLKMLNGNVYEMLNSIDYTYMQIMSETKGIAPFTFDQHFYVELKRIVEARKELLMQYKELEQYGSQLSNGAYDYALNLNQLCEENYGRRIF